MRLSSKFSINFFKINRKLFSFIYKLVKTAIKQRLCSFH